MSEEKCGVLSRNKFCNEPSRERSRCSLLPADPSVLSSQIFPKDSNPEEMGRAQHVNKWLLDPWIFNQTGFMASPKPIPGCRNGVFPTNSVEKSRGSAQVGVGLRGWAWRGSEPGRNWPLRVFSSFCHHLNVDPVQNSTCACCLEQRGGSTSGQMCWKRGWQCKPSREGCDGLVTFVVVIPKMSQNSAQK